MLEDGKINIVDDGGAVLNFGVEYERKSVINGSE